MTTPLQFTATPLLTEQPKLFSKHDFEFAGKKHTIIFIPAGSQNYGLLSKPLWEKMEEIYKAALTEAATTSKTTPEKMAEQVQSVSFDCSKSDNSITYTYLDPAKASQFPRSLKITEITQLFQDIRKIIQAKDKLIRYLPTYDLSRDSGTTPDDKIVPPSASTAPSPRSSQPAPTPPLPRKHLTSYNVTRVSSLTTKQSIPGSPIGLGNLGNNCWANSLFQMIC
ncbi:MAG: hypothetical protein WCP39_03085, partial [Chlamydiota bacterium]